MTPFSFHPRWSFTEGDREGSSAEGEGEGISKHGAKAAQGLLNREPGAGRAPAACGVPRATATRSWLWPCTLRALSKPKEVEKKSKACAPRTVWGVRGLASETLLPA